MRRPTCTLAAAAVLALSTACASSSSFKTWKNPDAGARSFVNVGVFAFAQDPQVRRTTENMFLRAATGGTKVVASYSLFKDAELKDKDAVVAKVKASGLDAIVVFRVIAVEERESETYGVTGYTAAPYYGGFSSYYGYYGVATFGTVYTTKEKIVQIETTVYAVSDEKLVWVSQAKFDAPESTLDVLEGIVDSAAQAMRKEQLIK